MEVIEVDVIDSKTIERSLKSAWDVCRVSLDVEYAVLHRLSVAKAKLCGQEDLAPLPRLLQPMVTLISPTDTANIPHRGHSPFADDDFAVSIHIGGIPVTHAAFVDALWTTGVLSRLTSLDLRTTPRCYLKWTPHFPSMAKSLKHCTVCIPVIEEKDTDPLWISQLRTSRSLRT